MLNGKVAIRYAVASAVMIAGAWWLGGWGWLYVHGARGYSRSVGVAAAYPLSAGVAIDIEQALGRRWSVAPQTLLDDVWMERLREFAAGLPEVSARWA